VAPIAGSCFQATSGCSPTDSARLRSSIVTSRMPTPTVAATISQLAVCTLGCLLIMPKTGRTVEGKPGQLTDARSHCAKPKLSAADDQHAPSARPVSEDSGGHFDDWYKGGDASVGRSTRPPSSSACSRSRLAGRESTADQQGQPKRGTAHTDHAAQQPDRSAGRV
jgi:hypothetical protein